MKISSFLSYSNPMAIPAPRSMVIAKSYDVHLMLINNILRYFQKIISYYWLYWLSTKKYRYVTALYTPNTHFI